MRRPKKPNWPIHNHRFDVISTVVSGLLEDHRFEFEDVENGHRLFDVKYDGANSKLVPVGVSGLMKPVSSSLARMGTQYTIPAGKFHSTFVPMNCRTITIVQCVNFQDIAPSVYADTLGEPSDYVRLGYDRSEFWSQIGEAMNAFRSVV